MSPEVLAVYVVATALIAIFQLNAFLNPRYSVTSPKIIRRYWARVLDKRPPRHAKFGRGWILIVAEKAFAFSNGFSISQHGRAWIRVNNGREPDPKKRANTDAREANWIDAYIATNFLVLILLLVCDVRSGWAAAYSIYVVAEMVQRTVNVILFDKFRGHPAPADTRRSLLIGLLNILLVVVGFSVIWYSMSGLCEPLSRSTDVLQFVRHSAGVSGFTDGLCTADQSGAASWVNIAQNIATIWTMVVVLSYSVGALPRRE